MQYSEILKTCKLIDYKHEVIGKLGFTQWKEVWQSQTKKYCAIFTEQCTDKPHIIITFSL